MRNEKVQKLTLTALMAALSYVIFTFLQIKVTLPGGSATSFHLGNAVVVLAALLLGGVYGGIGGAIGMTIGDLLDPIYITLSLIHISEPTRRTPISYAVFCLKKKKKYKRKPRADHENADDSVRKQVMKSR